MERTARDIVCLKYEIPFVVNRALLDKDDVEAHESYGFNRIRR